MAFILFAILFLLNCLSASSPSNRKSPEGLSIKTTISNEWDPSKDAIFESSSGLCHFESSPNEKFPVSHLESSYFSKEVARSLSNPRSRSESSSSNDSDSESSSSSFLYVPEKCKNFQRKWDFYFGIPENDTKVIGWVSRIGFADNIIKELQGPVRNASYTLLPHGFCDKNALRKKLIDAQYLEIITKAENLFFDLYNISKPVDNILRKVILAIVITFASDGDSISIKILTDPMAEAQSGIFAYDLILQYYSFVGYYQPYF